MRKLMAGFLLCASPGYAFDGSAPTPLRGYTPEHSQAEVQWEQKFRGITEPTHIRDNAQRLSARPHHVGSAYDKDNAEWLLGQLKSYGLDAIGCAPVSQEAADAYEKALNRLLSDPRRKVALAHKDLAAAQALGHELGVATPVAALTDARCERIFGLPEPE